MNNFKGGGPRNGGQKFGGKKNFGGGKKYGDGQRRDERPSGGAAQLFSATCSECNKRCDVPFKPSNDKPVYCSACFGMKKSANESRGGGNGGNQPERNGGSNTRPDYTKAPRDQRSPRHDPTRGRSDDGIADLKRQIAGLEQKLNRILDLINPPTPSKKVPIPVTEKVATEVAPKAEVKNTKKAAPKKTVKKVAAKKTPAKKVAKKAAKPAAKKVAKKAKK